LGQKIQETKKTPNPILDDIPNNCWSKNQSNIDFDCVSISGDTIKISDDEFSSQSESQYSKIANNNKKFAK